LTLKSAPAIPTWDFDKKKIGIETAENRGFNRFDGQPAFRDARDRNHESLQGAGAIDAAVEEFPNPPQSFPLSE